MIINMKNLSSEKAYKLLSGAIVPRPIAWVSTISKEGNMNLAPFSFFTVVSRNPPTLGISIGPGIGSREGTIKDTLLNIMETKEFVVNIVSKELVVEMHQSSGNYPPEENEFEHTGLTPVSSESVKAPRILESPISMECRLTKSMEIGTDTFLLGEIMQFHIDDTLYINHYKINIQKLEPIARLAGNYAEIKSLFTLEKPYE
ncbi:flavin reductase family protein [Alkalihalophilus marmarensis]|uniref:flavin reductase family protein n=1 Tax=Alkalihalophilus marmarensis TaxID=521377 RepID=UPI002DB96A2E|nr:flavin reductase family protein [Alkalihalophilus marmarensis]MEC2073230.1 flavin reductase family protein [Alkalihalophilus marmarensis]